MSSKNVIMYILLYTERETPWLYCKMKHFPVEQLPNLSSLLCEIPC